MQRLDEVKIELQCAKEQYRDASKKLRDLEKEYIEQVKKTHPIVWFIRFKSCCSYRTSSEYFFTTKEKGIELFSVNNDISEWKLHTCYAKEPCDVDSYYWNSLDHVPEEEEHYQRDGYG